MLSEHLHHVCRTTLNVLAPAVAGEFFAVDLVQIDRKEFEFQTVAAAHYTQGPLRRMVVGCEERLASHLARTWDVAMSTGPADGLGAFCRRLQVALGRDGSHGHLESQPFLGHDAAAFRVFCDGPRNFYFRAASAEGRLDLVLDMAPRNLGCHWIEDELRSAPHDLTGGGTGDNVSDAAIVERIMVYLCESGADIQVKLAAQDDRFELLPATFLRGGMDRSTHTLALTCARRPGVLDEHDVPDQIELVFVLQEKLLQCTCPVLGQTTTDLDDDIALPTLQIAFPRTVTYGQRRGALRVAPATRITGTIQRLSEASTNLGLVRGRIPIEVDDISYTGARLTLAANAILSGFKGGAPVECLFQLPPPVGPVRVSGHVRRLSMYSNGKLQRGASLGVEFDATLGDTEAGLKAVHHYVRTCAGVPGTCGVVLEPCPRPA